MSSKTSNIRQSKSSNDQSFEALNESNERGQEQKNRPSNSSDFQNIYDVKFQNAEISDSQQHRQSQVNKQLNNLQKLLIESEKSIDGQFEILKVKYQQREKEIQSIQAENDQLKKSLHELEQCNNFYKEQLSKAKKFIEQKSNVSGSIKKAQQSLQKDFSKKSVSKNLGTSDDELYEKVKECEFKINSFHTKLQFFTEQDRKVRQFLSKALKFNPSFPMQLSTLVQSAVIQLESNLKEVNREIENIILGAHLGNSNKISARRENKDEEKYNHWQVLSNLDVIKDYVNEYYKSR